MKAELYDVKGNKKSEVALPELFDTKVRDDIAFKTYQAIKFMLMQPYSHAPEAGKRHSASGTISHRRHEWKGHYGKGIARVPRKVMWRRGTQFMWVGAEVTSARGGRRVHGPVLIKRPKKINKAEYILALQSCLASTFDENTVSHRYSSISKPMKSVVIESKLDNVKAKELLATVEKLFSEYAFVLQSKDVRAGKGKTRGRRYKSNQGVLMIKASDEKIKANGIDIVSAKDVSIIDVYPLGRLTVYTEKGLKELESLGNEVKETKEAGK
jgi:large subunit ribosomal protein L4e